MSPPAIESLRDFSSLSSAWVQLSHPCWWAAIPRDFPAEQRRIELDREFHRWAHGERWRLFGIDPEITYDYQRTDVDDAELREPALGDLSRAGSPDWLAEIEARHPGDEVVRWLARRRHQSALARAWQASDPAFIERSLAHQERARERDASLFGNHPMCRPGVLVELMHPNGGVEWHVLGGEVLDGEGRGGAQGALDESNVHPNALVLRCRDLLAGVAMSE